MLLKILFQAHQAIFSLDNPDLLLSGRVEGKRERAINRTPFIAAYRIQGEFVRILRLLHGAQKWP